jgi:hypothetical protein
MALLLLGACNRYTQEDETVVSYGIQNDVANSTSLVLPQQDPYMLRTSFRANDLDLETPLRCNVNWKTQEMVQILPHNNVSFRIDRNDVNDPLPKFEVKNFTFDNIPAEQALFQLTKEAGITLVAKDAPYPTLYGKNINGSFSEVVEMIARSADLFYRYDAKMNSIILSRRASFTLYAPSSRTLLLGFLDILRGAGITDMITNWRDYSISFETNLETMDKINDLIKEFENGVTLHDGTHLKPTGLKIVDNNKCIVTLTEGKYHQIRRMFGAVGNKVVYLERIKEGTIELDKNLKRGEWRYLTEKELSENL